MKKELEKKVIERLATMSERKKRYNFTISPHVKMAFTDWCKEQGCKESAAIEAIIIEMIPKKYFK